jgi:hypothetical protein
VNKIIFYIITNKITFYDIGLPSRAKNKIVVNLLAAVLMTCHKMGWWPLGTIGFGTLAEYSQIRMQGLRARPKTKLGSRHPDKAFVGIAGLLPPAAQSARTS